MREITPMDWTTGTECAGDGGRRRRGWVDDVVRCGQEQWQTNKQTLVTGFPYYTRTQSL